MEPPSFPADGTFLANAGTWIDFDQILNQQDSPYFAHNFNLGADFQLYANSGWSLSLLGNEVFQFKVFPDNPLLFNPRALLTTVVLMNDFRLGESTGELWLQHDCNHSIDQSPLRDSVHTSVIVGWSLPTKERLLFGQPLVFGLRAQESAILALYYQNVSSEPEVEHTSLELHWLPLALGPRMNVFVDAQGAVIVRRQDTPVSVASAVNLDARGVIGVEFEGERGNLRVFYRLDRTTDPEVDNSPVPSVTSTLGIEVLSP